MSVTDEQARRNPAGYRTRVLLIALLGNAYLGVMLVLVVALFALALVSVAWLKAAGVKLALVLGVFLWMLLKALRVKMEAPQGTELTAHEPTAVRTGGRIRIGSEEFVFAPPSG